MRVMNGLLNFTTEETKLFFSAKKRIWAFLCILSVLCGESLLHAQKRLVLDLNRTIALANDSSLESFRTQNMYLSGYWEYRTYKANRLPSLTLDLLRRNITGILRNVTIRDRIWMCTVRNSLIMLMEG